MGSLRLRFEEAVEAIAGGRVHNDESVRAVVGHGLRGDDPVRSVEVGVLLQRETGRGRRPRDERGVVRGEANGQQWRAGRLHGEERPESAGEREVPSRHRLRMGVRLADGAAHGKDPARARATAAVGGEPVEGGGLGSGD